MNFFPRDFMLVFVAFLALLVVNGYSQLSPVSFSFTNGLTLTDNAGVSYDLGSYQWNDSMLGPNDYMAASINGNPWSSPAHVSTAYYNGVVTMVIRVGPNVMSGSPTGVAVYEGPSLESLTYMGTNSPGLVAVRAAMDNYDYSFYPNPVPGGDTNDPTLYWNANFYSHSGAPLQSPPGDLGGYIGDVSSFSAAIPRVGGVGDVGDVGGVGYSDVYFLQAQELCTGLQFENGEWFLPSWR